MADFLRMGGYGFYVWCSYGVVAMLLVYHYLLPRIKQKKLLKELGSELESTLESEQDSEQNSERACEPARQNQRDSPV